MDNVSQSTTTVHEYDPRPDNSQNIQICRNTVLDSNKFALIWFDEHCNDDINNDITQTKCALEEFTSNVVYFDNGQKCYEFIANSPVAKSLFVIVSGKSADSLLSKIHNLTKIDSVFVFCIKPESYEYLLEKYFKIVIIVTNATHLLNTIKQSLELAKRHYVTFSLYEDHQASNRNLTQNASSFLWFKIFIDVIQSITHAEKAKEEAKQEMVKKCKFYYRTNVSQLSNIEKFNKTYKSSDAIRWYTEDSFVYRLINKALRTEAFEECYTFRYFIGDLVNELRSRHKDFIIRQKSLKNSTNITIYRGTKLALVDIRKLSIGCLVSPNGFLSTSLSWQVAAEKYACIYSKDTDTSFQSVVYEITVDLSDINNNTILADISEFSAFPDESEILISLCATFCINDIIPTDDETAKFWTIKMTATGAGSNIKEAYMQRYTCQIQNMKSASTMIAVSYNETGQYEKAKAWLNSRRKETTHVIDHVDHLFLLGFAEYGLLNYSEALEHFQEVYRQRMLPEYYLNFDKESLTLLNHDNVLAYNLFCIGHVYGKLGKYEKAKDYYNKSLQISKRNFNENKTNMIRVMVSLGTIESLEGNENGALELFENCLKFYDDDQYEEDSIFGYIKVRMGLIYYKKQKYELALAYFQDVLKFYDDFNPIEYYNPISHYLLNIEADNPVARCHLGIGVCHMGVALYNRQQASFDLANKHFFKALSLCQSQCDKKLLTCCYYNLGGSYGYSNEYNNCLDYYTKIFNIDGSISEKEKVVIIYNVYNAVWYYFRRRNFNDNSLRYCQKAIDILERLLPQQNAKKIGADIVFKIIQTKVSGNRLQQWLMKIPLLFINLGSLIIVFVRKIRRFMHV